MTTTDANALYELLPAFVRLRDQTQGGALQDLVAVIAAQAQVVSAGLDQQYDDQFIETCALWVVPYIGDLIGFTPLQPLGPGQPSATRAEVADTIGYRRRKGTLAMLEQLCFDVTGWAAIGVEYFTRLSTTQYVRNHVRPGNTVVNVRSPMVAVDIDGPFDLPPRTADVRRIDSGRGRYNIANIGLFVWRLAPYPNAGHPAHFVKTGCYTFDPFGGDVPLVNPPVVAASTFDLVTRPNLPFALQRYPLYVQGTPDAPTPYAAPVPVGIAVNGVPVAPATVGWCDLTSWAVPTTVGIEVSVDPVRGRLVFAAAPAGTDAVTVDYTYAFSGDYGGGSYEYTPLVGADDAAAEGALHVTQTPLAGADFAGAHDEVIEITDSGILVADVTLSPDANLLVVRAADLQRPVVTGNLTITAVKGASVTLRGIGIGGTLTVVGAGAFTLQLEHCTLRQTLDWSSDAVTGTLVIDHCLCGPVEVNADVEVAVADSAIDAGTDTAAALAAGGGAPAGSVTIQRSTIIGSVTARTIPRLENSIVTGPVVTTERQAGCVRYSFLPAALSRTPRRFRCQPDREIDATLAADSDLTSAQRDAIVASVEAWLLPSFTSRTAGTPGYLQLADVAPDQIRFGADADDEMGVFYGLFSARRESNLRYRLNEYLRIGLEAGIIHAT